MDFKQVAKLPADHDAHFDLMDIASVTTLETAMQAQKVYIVKKKLGEETLLKLVLVILKNFCDSINVKDQMTAMQMIDCAQLFSEKYTHESVEDLILCLKKVKSGEYGPIYNRVDTAAILGFFARYLEERETYRESKIKDYKAQEASNELGIFKNLPEETRKALLNKNIESLPVHHNTRLPLDETEYKAEIMLWMQTASDEDIEGGVTYYMRNGNKEYLALMEKELEERKRKRA